MKRETIININNIPIAGVFAFAVASVWSLFQMFNNNALHPTLLYWIPAFLIEIVTAWLVYQTVESIRLVTRSNISKQDRRFNMILAIVCAILAAPTLMMSFSANHYEFQGHAGLARIFPIGCVACAVATAIPHIKTRNVDERLMQEREKHVKARAKLEQSLADVCIELKETKRFEVEVNRLNGLLDEAEKKLNAPFAEAFSNGRSVPHKMAHNVMVRDGWGCYWCGRDLRAVPRHKIHIDHFYPDSKGGATDEFNLVVSCESCNLSKSSREPSDKQVRDFQIYLVNNSNLQQKEKVWALHLVGAIDKQRDIAGKLGVSPSYVSSSIADIPESPNGRIAELCERLALVGKPELEQENKET